MTKRFELIEAYSMNKLSASESAAFEAEMAKDPALKNEVELQKDIISSIQNSRKIELKSRLAGLEVKPGLTMLQKFGIGAVAISALFFLTYNLVDDSTSSSIEETSATRNTVEEITPQTEIISEEVSEEIEIINEEGSTLVANNNVNEEIALTKEVEKIPTQTNSSTPNNLITVQVPVLDSDDEIVEHDNIGTPKSFAGTQDEDEIKGIIPSFESKSKKHRQYKYDGENLTLIGNFNSEEPYFLIEKPDKATTEMYLKFENTFYAIKETKKAADLEEVTNESMIKELNKK